MTSPSAPRPLRTTESPHVPLAPATGVATAIPANLPHSHSRCGKRWSGARTAHCGSCCVTTTGETAFRAHRRDGHCVDPATVGLVLIPGRAYDVWGTTGGEAAGDE